MSATHLFLFNMFLRCNSDGYNIDASLALYFTAAAHSLTDPLNRFELLSEIERKLEINKKNLNQSFHSNVS